WIGLNATSEGLRLLRTANRAHIERVTIENFNKGVHLIGDDQFAPNPALDLLGDVAFDDIRVGVGQTVNTAAVHSEGPVGDVYFHHFFLGAQQRVILVDGNGGTGGSISFTDGFLNSTLNTGVASVKVETLDLSGHSVLLSQIQDWETSC